MDGKVFYISLTSSTLTILLKNGYITLGGEIFNFCNDHVFCSGINFNLNNDSPTHARFLRNFDVLFINAHESIFSVQTYLRIIILYLLSYMARRKLQCPTKDYRGRKYSLSVLQLCLDKINSSFLLEF